MTDSPIRRTSKLVAVHIDGYFMPVEQNGQPVILSMPGSTFLYISVFKDKLAIARLWLDYPQLPRFARVATITDGQVFVQSLIDNKQPDLRLIIDPYKHDSGKLRWLELPLTGDLISPT